MQEAVIELSARYYKQATEAGIAKECARMLLPMSTRTILYMKGSVRSWIYYLEARCNAAAQKEHRDIAVAIRDGCFLEIFPHTWAAVFGSYDLPTEI